LEALDAGPVDEKDCRAALVHFGPLWDSLSTREQARISHTLVARVAYDGTSAIPYNLQNRGIAFSWETPRGKRDVLASGGGKPANALNYGLRSGYPPPHRLRTDAGAHIVAYAHCVRISEDGDSLYANRWARGDRQNRRGKRFGKQSVGIDLQSMKRVRCHGSA
jgi:hypothetical protein